MPSLKEALHDVLATADFDRRFYRLYEQLRDRETERRWKNEEIAAVLAETDLPFKYVKSERFFSHTRRAANATITLSVRVRDSEIELLMEISRGGELTGGPFQLLARDVATKRQPGFQYDPPYPWLPFASPDDLRLIVRFAISTFEEIRKAFAPT